MTIPHEAAPHLSKKDIQAIRGTLPGKFLGLTAALLSLLWMAVYRAFRLSTFLSDKLHLPVTLSEWITFGGAPLVVVIVLARQWQVARNVRALKLLAVSPRAATESYFKIGPYTSSPEDQARFGRSDGVHHKVAKWIAQSDRSTLYLTGDSGAGKSSLLTAYVLPQLRSQGWKVFEARAWQDPFAQIQQALGRPPTNSEASGAEEQIRQILQAARARSRKVLLILDQFEEFLILGEEPRVKEFARFISDLEATPIKGVAILLALRSDYLAMLDERGFPPLRQSENWLQVGRFTLAAATSFMKNSGLDLETEALDQVVSSAALMDDSPGIVRPITLNVVGYVLSEGQTRAHSLDAGTLVRRYIEQVIDSDATRDIARPVLERLVTEEGTKQPISEATLVHETRLPRGEVRAVLNSLSAAALARPLDAAQGVWELTHDFVARAVMRYLGRHDRKFWRTAAAFAAPALFGVLVAIFLGSVVFIREDRTSKADVHVTPTPEVQKVVGEFAPVVYVIKVAGEDVQFDSLDYEFRRTNGTSILKKFDMRPLGGGFKVRAGTEYRFPDNIYVPKEICGKLNRDDNGEMNFDYTFNGVDMHKIQVQVHAILRLEC